MYYTSPITYIDRCQQLYFFMLEQIYIYRWIIHELFEYLVYNLETDSIGIFRVLRF